MPALKWLNSLAGGTVDAVMSAPIKGVICHHTGGPLSGNMPSLGVVTNGRPDLPGPLAQLCLGRDGTMYVVAAGRCNHAGTGNWQGFTRGNTNFIGIEAENTGFTRGPKADPWPAVQMDAYRRGVAAILKKIRANAIMVCGHKEYALPPGRKIDPTFDMNDFRLQVAAIMAGTAPLPYVIPVIDGEGRKTLRRGARGNQVKQVQTQGGRRREWHLRCCDRSRSQAFPARPQTGSGRHRRTPNMGYAFYPFRLGHASTRSLQPIKSGLGH